MQSRTNRYAFKRVGPHQAAFSCLQMEADSQKAYVMIQPGGLKLFRPQILPSRKYRKVLRRGRITLPKTFYLYNPILNTTAIRILIQPVTNLEIVTAAIPTWVVSGFASVIPRPTGIKSQAH